MRLLHCVVGSIVSCATALLFACGGGHSSGQPPPADGGVDGSTPSDAPPPPPPSDAPFTAMDAGTLGAFCDGTYGAYVRSFEACCNAADQQTFQYKFGDALLHVLVGLCETELPASLAAGRIRYDASSGQACISAVQGIIAGYTCGGTYPAPTMPNASCQMAIVGLQAAGAPCADEYECQDGLTCIGYVLASKNSPATPGTCSTPPATGQTCGAGHPDGGGSVVVHWTFGNHPDCASGDYCPSSGTCTVQGPSGASCSADGECQSGLLCHEGKCGTTGPASAGGACQTDSDCDKTQSLYCGNVDGGAMVCTPKEAAGTPCTGPLGSECKGICDVPDGGGNRGSCATFCGSG